MSTKDWIEKDFYKVLGVSKGATADEIRKSYRALARTHHPDKNPDNAAAEARFKEVSEAYDVLSDPASRKEYDEARALFGGNPHAPNLDDLLTQMRQQGGGAGGPAGTGGGLGGIFGDVLGGFFNRGAQQRPTAYLARRGADIESEATIAFHEALDGVTVHLRMTTDEPCSTCSGTGARAGTAPRLCPACNGTGQVLRSGGGFAMPEPCRDCRGRGMVVDDPCPTCSGSGRGRAARPVSARIPAGVADGGRIRLKGKGAPGEHGGPPGDLFVVVHVSAHPVFIRNADSVLLTVPVRFAEAALGAEVPVPLPRGGHVTLKIPAGTANGRTFRVRGRGAGRRDGTVGDLLVTIEVKVPRNLPDAARDALSAYVSAFDEPDPRVGLDRAAGQLGGS